MSNYLITNAVSTARGKRDTNNGLTLEMTIGDISGTFSRFDLCVTGRPNMFSFNMIIITNRHRNNT